MKIAQVGTIWERTPPEFYGGTERIVSNLTDGLVERGHDVTLFATGDSITKAKLEYVVPEAAYRSGISWENFLYPLHHISNVFERANEFDLIHMHLNTRQDYVSLVLAGFVQTPTLFTMHFVLPKENDVKKADRFNLLTKYRKRNFSTISNAQRTLDFLNYVGTVYNGIDMTKFPFIADRGEYLVWLGRICHDKGTKEAIDVAKKSGQKLILAGKVDEHNSEYLTYFEREVKPHIDGNQIQFIGEVDDRSKIELFKKAKVLLNPINWNEPFGLVTVEAMATGVPVIAFNNGPVKEQIIDGVTGFVVKNTDEMGEKIDASETLDRKKIRECTVKKFSVDAMVENYLTMYKSLIQKK
ncbi:glycosyltransferase family 4 protein [Candidatus Parcubacteria bacterium]|nr:glycosyltransferase family 4 protein [Candidatus Parcubacteria bacterium]